jgi:hypothetical protein
VEWVAEWVVEWADMQLQRLLHQRQLQQLPRRLQLQLQQLRHQRRQAWEWAVVVWAEACKIHFRVLH